MMCNLQLSINLNNNNNTNNDNNQRRNYKNYGCICRKNYNKMFSMVVLTLQCILLTNFSHGHPTSQELAPISVPTTTTTTSGAPSESTTFPYNLNHGAGVTVTEYFSGLIDPQYDVLSNSTINEKLSYPSTTTTIKSSNDVEFSDVPSHIECEIGTSILLPCRTVFPVAECQWSWQPLPPRHLPLPDISEIPTITTTTVEEDLQNPFKQSEPISQPLPVRQFAAFGNNSNDCSVRFSSAKHEQAGYWTCAVRRIDSNEFRSTKPAKLTIISIDHELPIRFIKRSTIVEASVGSSTQINCRTEHPVRECQWYWRQLNQSQSWNLEVKKFPAFGNDSKDCSIKFKNVLAEQEGYWTCGARSNLNSTFTQSSPIRFLISGVEFVQLSRGVQIAAGETVLLRCSINKPVFLCEWSWRPSNATKVKTNVKKFTPDKESEQDCSVRFKNILYEEEGLWTCGVRLSPDGILHEAPPAVVTLLPPTKVSFIETPQDTSVAAGTAANLRCVTNARVEKCSWIWKPLNGDDIETVVKEFSSKGELGKDCSLLLPQVFTEQQGFWGCQVWLPSQNSMQSAPVVKLTVFEVDEVKFSELSQDIQISSGGSVLLRCVTSSTVEQCRWSLTPDSTNTTVVVKQFPAAGADSRDCSVRLSHALAEQEGLWTCGARIRGRQNYTDAPPAKLSLLQPEPVMIALWTTPLQKINLACRLSPVIPKAQCHWLRAPDVDLQPNLTAKKSRYVVQMNYSTGFCSLQFKPDEEDLGEWMCKFTDEDNNTELGTASLVVFGTLPDPRLGWIVGLLTGMVLLLMIIVVVLVVCRTHIFFNRTSNILETIPSNSQRKRVNGENNSNCYMEGPNKINFQFRTDQSSLNINANQGPTVSDEQKKKKVNEIYENIG